MKNIQLKYTNNSFIEEFGPPKYETPGAAAVDLRACIDMAITIQPGDVELVGTGIALNMKDDGMCAILLPRSGLGVKGLVLANGTGLIDSDYQGEIPQSVCS